MLVLDLLRDIDNGLTKDAILGSIYEVEDVLVMLAEMDKKVDYLKGLREYRIQSINEEIDKINEKSMQLRELILRSIKKLEPSQNTFLFPGVGKVTRKQLSGSWEIENEAVMLDSLDKLGLKDRVIEKKEVLNKREAKKVIAELADQNKKVAGTFFKKGGETISVTLEMNKPKPVEKAGSAPTAQHAHKSIDLLEALDV